MTKGLFAIHTGKGKGKTTAALGMVFRALGHGHKVAIIQFIKGNNRTGEYQLAKHFPHLLEMHVTGRGFTWKSDDINKDSQLAREAWGLARSIIDDSSYRLVVLDELTYLIKYGMVSEEEVLTVIEQRPASMHVIVTGRDASDRLIDSADLVTEMVERKHPLRAGIKAQKGFDF
ncbi:MAG: cob(I)yrinic acid a,c-diamide adenosyltransferase [Desulfopila sp.]